MENSKAEKLLRFLKSGGTVTGKTSMSRFGIYRLSSAIHRFRRDKRLNIVTSKVTWRGVQYAKYKLEKQ